MPNIAKIPEGAMFLTAAREQLDLVIASINAGGVPDPNLVPLLQQIHDIDAEVAKLMAFQVNATATIDSLVTTTQELEADKILKDQKILLLENSLADHEKRIALLEAAP